MTWIRSEPMEGAQGRLRAVYEKLYALYPPEYFGEVAALTRSDGGADSIMAAHSLIPEAMEAAFLTHARLLSAELPLTRRQHEMIGTLVSALNRCFY